MKRSKLLQSIAAANLLLGGATATQAAVTKKDETSKDFKVETISEENIDFSPAHNCCGCGGGTCNGSC